MGQLLAAAHCQDRGSKLVRLGVKAPVTLLGLLISGPLNGLTARSEVRASDESAEPPVTLQLRADRQFHDSRRNISIAEGNVRVVLGRDELLADRIEFDAGIKLSSHGALFVSDAVGNSFRPHRFATA